MVFNYLMKKHFLNKLPIHIKFIGVDKFYKEKIIRMNSDGRITKISSFTTNLEYDIMVFLCKKYNEIMGGGNLFTCSIIHKYSQIDCLCTNFTHPLMGIGVMNYLCSKRKLTEETENLLSEYINTEGTLLNNLLKMNPNIKTILLEIGSDKYKRDNYFSYKGKYYLLDIENFYFKLYDKNNNIIPINSITSKIPLGRYLGDEKEFKDKDCYVL